MQNFGFRIAPASPDSGVGRVEAGDCGLITKNPIDLENILKKAVDPSCGAMVLFTGIVRNHNEGKAVMKLFYECYESMADKQIRRIIDRAKEDWNVKDIYVRHRIGRLEVGEVALVIAVQAAHREEAFSACRAVLEGIKKTVPIWKKEIYADGASEWVLSCHPVEAPT